MVQLKPPLKNKHTFLFLCLLNTNILPPPHFLLVVSKKHSALWKVVRTLLFFFTRNCVYTFAEKANHLKLIAPAVAVENNCKKGWEIGFGLTRAPKSIITGFWPVPRYVNAIFLCSKDSCTIKERVLEGRFDKSKSRNRWR